MRLVIIIYKFVLCKMRSESKYVMPLVGCYLLGFNEGINYSILELFIVCDII